MSTLKDALCLLAILVVYGIVGQMDYEDAVAAQEAQQPSLPPDRPDCLSNASSVFPQGFSHSRWPDDRMAWQPAGNERCPRDSGVERARH